jgi:hypothetical protein
MLRTLVHAPEYTNQLRTLGDIQRLDDVLAGMEWALGSRAEYFDIVEGMEDVRLLLTDAIGGLPAFQVWFRIENETVHLLYIDRDDSAT